VVPKNLGKKTEHLFHFDLSISSSQSCAERRVIVIRDDAGLVAARKTFGMSLFGVGVQRQHQGKMKLLVLCSMAMLPT